MTTVEREYRIIWQGDLEEKVKEWLSDLTTSRLALLADYGGGKSTFCQHIAATLTKEYIESKEDGQYKKRLPLLLRLGDFAKAPVDLEGYLVAHLKQICKVDNPNFEALMKMAEAGLLLFLLDGFDEMASRATTDIVYQNIELFEKLANLPKNKVLLTTRPEYFMSLSQERKALRAYPCMYVQPFNKGQIDCYLQKRVPFLKLHWDKPTKDWKYYQQQINTIHDLADLARRPVLLEIIIKTLPSLAAEGEAVSRPNLYQRYLEGELDRQILLQRRYLLIDRQKRFEIMERIALEMYQTNRVTLTSNQILKVSRELLTLEQQREMEGSLREILTCSFLIRLGDDWRFSHQSFLEYLVGCCLAKDIVANKRDNFRLKPITLVIRNFLLEPIASTSQRNSATNYGINIKNWFETNPRDKWLSSNTISLLAEILTYKEFISLHLQGADLTDVDLSGFDLHRINLSRTTLIDANISKTNLSNADLQEATLIGANLDAAVLVATNLNKANLNKANLNKAVLRRAHLQGVDLSYADLSEADLSYANLSGADLTYADLNDAVLHTAILNRADLSYADLTGANLKYGDLRNATVTETDFSAANLSGTNLDGVNLERADISTANLIGSSNLIGSIYEFEDDVFDFFEDFDFYPEDEEKE